MFQAARSPLETNKPHPGNLYPSGAPAALLGTGLATGAANGIVRAREAAALAAAEAAVVVSAWPDSPSSSGYFWLPMNHGRTRRRRPAVVWRFGTMLESPEGILKGIPSPRSIVTVLH
jgi:hypothetical protein